MKCKICDCEFQNLGKHLSVHNITAKDYYKRYILQTTDDPLCPTCGCVLPFIKLTKGFPKFCSYKCRNTNTEWKEQHNQIILEKHGTLRITNDEKTKQTKNSNTLKKLNDLVHEYGTVEQYETNRVIYRCNRCKENQEYTYNFFKHRINYKMNPCAKCQATLLGFNQCSRLENDLCDFIENNCLYSLERHNRQILGGKELDIYIPELKIAFEFDGTYWHMDKRFYAASDVNQVKGCTAAEIWSDDLHKDQLCAEKFIKLYRIAEYDWLNDMDKTKEKILTLLKTEKNI